MNRFDRAGIVSRRPMMAWRTADEIQRDTRASGSPRGSSAVLRTFWLGPVKVARVRSDGAAARWGGRPVSDRPVNKRRAPPTDFVDTQRGTRLQSKVFGKVLASWESHWFEGNHEEELDREVRLLIRRIREQGASLPEHILGLENGVIQANT